MSNTKTYAIRLSPNADLKLELEKFAKEKNLQAAYIITCVGSLQQANLRLANQPKPTMWNKKFEIVSLVGTLSASTGMHLHASLADSTGATIGGHLTEGNLIYTTAEIVIGEITDVKFSRKIDSTFGYKELCVEER